jgi:hypothetical protein
LGGGCCVVICVWCGWLVWLGFVVWFDFVMVCVCCVCFSWG